MKPYFSEERASIGLQKPVPHALTTPPFFTMEAVSQIVTTVTTRTTTNLKSTFENMTPEKWIRIIIIAGAYALLRPYIIKLGAKAQMRAHEAEENQPEAEISPNQLRGQIDIPEDSDDEDAVAGTKGPKDETTAAVTATEWGKKARRRQRGVIKKLIDVEEERLRQLQEDEEDKDIEEFLIKS